MARKQHPALAREHPRPTKCSNSYSNPPFLNNRHKGKTNNPADVAAQLKKAKSESTGVPAKTLLPHNNENNSKSAATQIATLEGGGGGGNALTGVGGLRPAAEDALLPGDFSRYKSQTTRQRVPHRNRDVEG